MAIQIADGFQLRVAKPLDDRQNVETVAQLDPTYGYEGQIVYVKDIKQFYTCYKDENGSLAYKVMETGNAGGGDLIDYQEKTDNTLTTTDKTIVGAINEVNGNLLDTVEFSADYKNIILNRKNGLNPYTIPISAIINNASLTELKDIDSTDIGNGKTLVYDSSTQKHRYVNTTGTDEFVKMDNTTDAKYLSDLIDKSTVVNDNGVLKVKKLDGQEVTITEINHLKGLTMNIMDLVNAFSNGGVKVWETPVNTYSDLETLDRSTFIDGISYIVYVLIDETHSNAKTTYLCTKTSTTFFGNADNQRNFITNPIDLANEVTGKLGTSNIDVDNLWTLLTINDTYKTLTTNNEIFGTHGAKAMYDELTTAIGKKVNTSDIPTKVSELTNDSNYQTAKQVNSALENKANKTELNNYSYLGNLATRIPKNDDLNNYITPGIYTCSSIDIAKTLLNLPTGIDSSFRLEVIINTGDETNLYGSQEMRTNSNKIFIRTIRGAGGWSAWQELATMDGVPESVANPTELDTNKFNKNGYYSIGDVKNRTNLPIQQGGTLLVYYAGHYVIQEYILNENLRRFMRRSTDKGANWSAWQELATMDKLNHSTDEDIPKTTITPTFPNGIVVASGGAVINYIVKNGWCNVDFAFNVASAPVLSWTSIATGLPIPANSVNIVLINDGGKINRTIPIKINSTGSVYLRVPTEISATDWWTDNVSYPVAE